MGYRRAELTNGNGDCRDPAVYCEDCRGDGCGQMLEQLRGAGQHNTRDRIAECAVVDRVGQSIRDARGGLVCLHVKVHLERLSPITFFGERPTYGHELEATKFD